MELCGFLAGDGTFTFCECWQHVASAQKLVQETYGEYLTGIRAENFLMEQGYVVYYANSVQHRFCIGFGAKSRMMLLTAEQKDFIVANLSNALTVEQRKSMEALLGKMRSVKRRAFCREWRQNICSDFRLYKMLVNVPRNKYYGTLAYIRVWEV